MTRQRVGFMFAGWGFFFALAATILLAVIGEGIAAIVSGVGAFLFLFQMLMLSPDEEEADTDYGRGRTDGVIAEADGAEQAEKSNQ